MEKIKLASRQVIRWHAKGISDADPDHWRLLRYWEKTHARRREKEQSANFQIVRQTRLTSPSWLRVEILGTYKCIIVKKRRSSHIIHCCIFEFLHSWTLFLHFLLEIVRFLAKISAIGKYKSLSNQMENFVDNHFFYYVWLKPLFLGVWLCSWIN